MRSPAVKEAAAMTAWRAGWFHAIVFSQSWRILLHDQMSWNLTPLSKGFSYSALELKGGSR